MLSKRNIGPAMCTVILMVAVLWPVEAAGAATEHQQLRWEPIGFEVTETGVTLFLQVESSNKAGPRPEQIDAAPFELVMPTGRTVPAAAETIDIAWHKKRGIAGIEFRGQAEQDLATLKIAGQKLDVTLREGENGTYKGLESSAFTGEPKRFWGVLGGNADPGRTVYRVTVIVRVPKSLEGKDRKRAKKEKSGTVDLVGVRLVDVDGNEYPPRDTSEVNPFGFFGGVAPLNYAGAAYVWFEVPVGTEAKKLLLGFDRIDIRKGK